MSILNVNVGFLSLLFALGLVLGALMLKPMVENSASGMLLLARPAFSVGDQIRTTDFRGIVEEIGSRSTVLRTDDGIIVHVSNNQVLSSPIVVYSATKSRRSSFDIGVPLDTDLDDVTSDLMAAVRSVDDVVADPAPQIQASGVCRQCAHADDQLLVSVDHDQRIRGDRRGDPRDEGSVGKGRHRAEHPRREGDDHVDRTRGRANL